MKNNIACLLTLLFLSCATFVTAQNEDCELTINRAQEEYNAGRFYLIPSVLSSCLDQFSVEQRQRVYLLLTQTYLLLDDPFAARQSYLSLLKANPEFLTDTALHPIDVIYLSKKFTATPVFSWFGKAGINTTLYNIIRNQSTIGEQASETYRYKIGYQVGGGADFNFTDKISVRGGLLFHSLAYSKFSSNFFVNDSQTVTERQNWLTAPFAIVYAAPLGKYRPYGYAGYTLHYLLTSKANINITNDKPSLSGSDVADGQRERVVEESNDFDFKHKRNLFNQSILVGAGLKIKVGLDFFFVDIGYNFGLKNVLNSRNSFADYTNVDMTGIDISESMESSTSFMHVDDYFRLDNLSLSFGFIRPLYKPRELKRARTKNVAKQLKSR